MRQIAEASKTLIVGMGTTGLSVARFLHSHNFNFTVVDDQEQPPAYKQLIQDIAPVDLHVGISDSDCFDDADNIVVSPGVPF